jgi:hypothetical protein
MKDQPNEIANLINLILPLDEQMETGEDFDNEYLSRDSGIKPDRVKDLKNIFKGRISYLKNPITEVRKEYVGRSIGELKKFSVDPIEMSTYQYDHYKKALDMDRGEQLRGVYSNTRQASLFVYPDGSWGNDGFTKYVRRSQNIFSKKDVTYTYSLTSEFRNILEEGKSENDKKTTILNNLKKFSIKYYTCIKNILENRDHLSFAYCDLVEGSGAILLSKLLELLGIKNAIITNQTTTPRQIRNIIDSFNSPENMKGEKIQVIVGSKIISEGISLKNVRDIYILTPFWNYSETEQAIARGIRLFSHNDLIKAGITPYVKIYQYLAYNKALDLKDFVDYLMFLFSETKDFAIKKLERLIKECAFDCALNYERNLKGEEYNFKRECEYLNCDYKCDGQQSIILENSEIDKSTYDLYYFDEMIEKVKISLENMFKYNDIHSYDIIKRNLYNDLKENMGDFLILRILDFMINNNIPILNVNRQLCYLKSYNNFYYVDLMIDKDSSFTEWQYIKNPILFEYNNLDSITLKYQNELVNRITSELEDPEDPEKIKELFLLLDNDIQEIFIEASILNKLRDIETSSYFRNWVLKKYQTYITNIGNIWISKYLYSDKGIYKCLDISQLTWKWEVCDDKMNVIIEESEFTEKKKFEENIYGYYGLINKKDNKFKIVDTTINKKEEEQNKLIQNALSLYDETQNEYQFFQTKGENCKKMKKEELLNIILYLNLGYDEELNKKSRSELIEIASKYKENINTETSLEKLKTIVHWGQKTITVICKELQKIFKKDKRLKYTGKVCINWDKKDLINIILKTDIGIDKNSPKIKNKSKSDIIKILSSNKDIDYNLQELVDLEDEDLKRLLYWTMATKNEICEVLMEWFEKNSMLKYE